MCVCVCVCFNGILKVDGAKKAFAKVGTPVKCKCTDLENNSSKFGKLTLWGDVCVCVCDPPLATTPSSVAAVGEGSYLCAPLIHCAPRTAGEPHLAPTTRV